MIRVQVCNHCGASRAIVAAIREAQQAYGERIQFDLETCFSECHNLPVVLVNGNLLPDATPALIRQAIDRAVLKELDG